MPAVLEWVTAERSGAYDSAFKVRGRRVGRRYLAAHSDASKWGSVKSGVGEPIHRWLHTPVRPTRCGLAIVADLTALQGEKEASNRHGKANQNRQGRAIQHGQHGSVRRQVGPASYAFCRHDMGGQMRLLTVSAGILQRPIRLYPTLKKPGRRRAQCGDVGLTFWKFAGN